MPRAHPMMTFRALLAAVMLTATSSLAQDRDDPKNASKSPPEGAPWTMDFAEAHRLARETGRPIFVYSTKTY